MRRVTIIICSMTLILSVTVMQSLSQTTASQATVTDPNIDALFDEIDDLIHSIRSYKPLLKIYHSPGGNSRLYIRINRRRFYITQRRDSNEITFRGRGAGNNVQVSGDDSSLYVRINGVTYGPFHIDDIPIETNNDPDAGYATMLTAMSMRQQLMTQYQAGQIDATTVYQALSNIQNQLIAYEDELLALDALLEEGSQVLPDPTENACYQPDRTCTTEADWIAGWEEAQSAIIYENMCDHPDWTCTTDADWTAGWEAAEQLKNLSDGIPGTSGTGDLPDIPDGLLPDVPGGLLPDIPDDPDILDLPDIPGS